MTTLTPIEEIAAIIGQTERRPPKMCHTIDDQGWALCGAFKCDRSGLHRRSDCRREGHRRCVVCDELNRQLGDDAIAA